MLPPDRVSYHIFEGLIALCTKLNRVVYIWNCAHGKAPILNSNDHDLLYEVLYILEWFAAWRSDLVRRLLEENPHARRFFSREIWTEV